MFIPFAESTEYLESSEGPISTAGPDSIVVILFREKRFTIYNCSLNNDQVQLPKDDPDQVRGLSLSYVCFEFLDKMQMNPFS